MEEFVEGKIERLSADDFGEAMDFLNLVFSQASGAHDFQKLLPRLYQPTQKSMECNFSIRKNGRIRSIVGLFTHEFQVGSKTLKVGGIGGVATHKDERKSGMMQRLMNACMEEMGSGGFHLSCLGGLRHRYRYFGYEKAGTMYCYSLNKKSIQLFTTNCPIKKVNFQQMSENNSEWISYAKELYDNQPFHCIRSIDEFYLYLKSWNMIPWVALDEDGNMIGYLVANESNNQINEIFSSSTDTFLPILCQWVKNQKVQEVSLLLPVWAQEYIRDVKYVCESVLIRESYNWRIFQWIEVIRALFEVKCRMSSLADGEVNIQIDDYGIIQISVKNGLPSCKMTKQRPHLSCNYQTATQLLFGPVPPENIIDLPHDIQWLLSSWLPLPLSWHAQDGI